MRPLKCLQLYGVEIRLHLTVSIVYTIVSTVIIVYTIVSTVIIVYIIISPLNSCIFIYIEYWTLNKYYYYLHNITAIIHIYHAVTQTFFLSGIMTLPSSSYSN